MQRYFMTLAYKGTNYHGWQRQPNGLTIQEILEDALSTILGIPISVYGAGRTDAGVHAFSMTAHFDVPEPLKAPENLALRLSGFLPSDIAVYNIRSVNDDAHSRFDAIARRYEYHVILNKNPFLHGMATRLKFKADFELMNKAAACLVDYTDFTSFSKYHTQTKTNNCKIFFARWEFRDDHYVFNIQANRFLRDMVRAIVGTLLDVGRGKRTVKEFQDIIEAKDRRYAGASAPAEGLYLAEIIYPPELFET